MRRDRVFIDSQPALLAAEMVRVIQATTPNEQDIIEIHRQVLCRHQQLGLAKKAAPEEIIEGFYRCLVTDHLQRRFKIEIGEIPRCINSSHTATRTICNAESGHSHQFIPDAEWEKGWRDFQLQQPEVNIHVPQRRMPRRADLYIAVQGGVVSVEFKYLGSQRSLNFEGCAVQMRQYVENHAATLMVIYAGLSNREEIRGMDQLCRGLGPDVHVILIRGLAISLMTADIEKANRLFREAGLAFPTLPAKLASQLKERDNWCFSTREIDWDNYMWPYNLNYYVHEFEEKHVQDYAVISHSGHGINSYALQYYLVCEHLGLFLHLGWGGCYMVDYEDSAKIRDCFRLADKIVSAVRNLGTFGENDRLLIVVSDFYGSFWVPPGGNRREKDALPKGPAEMLTEVLQWLRNTR